MNAPSGISFLRKKKVQLFFDKEITRIAWMEWYFPLKVWAGSREQSWVSVPPPFYSHTHCSALQSHSMEALWPACVLWLASSFPCWLWTQLPSMRDHSTTHHWGTSTACPHLFQEVNDLPGHTFMYRMSTFIKWGNGQGVQTLCRNSNR